MSRRLIGWALVAGAALLSPAAPGHAASRVAERLHDGCRLLAGGRWQAAASAFREALAEDRQCAVALAGEGAALVLAGFEEGAGESFERALVLDSRLAAAYVGRGSVRYLRGNLADAWADYQRALAEGSAHPAAVRASSAHVACALGQYATADNLARQALAESPGHELGLQVRAAAQLGLGHAGETLAVLTSPPRPSATGELCVPSVSPLFAPECRYYADQGLEQRRLLAEGGMAVSAGEPRTGAAGGASDPAFVIEWPRAGAQVTGRTEVGIYAAPGVDVQYVAVLLDGQFAGMSNAPPYRVSVDAGACPDGLREIRVDAYGAKGSVTRTASIIVSVSRGQRTLAAEEEEARAEVADFLEGCLVLGADPLARAQLVGHALEAMGRAEEAVGAYEYAFSMKPTMPSIRADLVVCYRKLGLADGGHGHEIHALPDGDHVALTFDDGPHPVLTPWILDLLDRYQAKATFLLVGRQVEMYPEVTRAIVRRGHEIGSHSYTHSNLRQVSRLGVERELVMSRLMMRRACGEFVTLFRPPGGNYDPQVRQAVASTGFTTVFWTENITSYPGQSGPDILPKMLNRIGRNGIVLLHNGYDETREVLPLLLPALAQRGLKMDTVSALTGRRRPALPSAILCPPDWKL